jgi:hypothetical protein
MIYSHTAGGVPVYREGALNDYELGHRNTSVQAARAQEVVDVDVFTQEHPG